MIPERIPNTARGRKKLALALVASAYDVVRPRLGESGLLEGAALITGASPETTDQLPDDALHQLTVYVDSRLAIMQEAVTRIRAFFAKGPDEVFDDDIFSESLLEAQRRRLAVVPPSLQWIANRGFETGWRDFKLSGDEQGYALLVPAATSDALLARRLESNSDFLIFETLRARLLLHWETTLGESVELVTAYGAWDWSASEALGQPAEADIETVIDTVLDLAIADLANNLR